MVMEQAAFKFNAVRRQSDGVAGRRKRKRFEITADQQIDGIGRRNVRAGFAHGGIGKCEYGIAGRNDGASVADLEINGSVILDGKELNGGSKFIELSDLNVSAHKDLYALLCKRNLCKLADHGLVIFDQLLASNVEFRLENLIEMLRKILYGKFSDARRADMRKRARLRTAAQSHDADLAVCIRGAHVFAVRQIVSRRVFAILRDYPISIHVLLPIS